LILSPCWHISRPDTLNPGLTEAIDHAKGKSTNIIEHKPDSINVKAVRDKTGMSQQKFCATFGISIGTLTALGARSSSS